jgi:hypothetical protein
VKKIGRGGRWGSTMSLGCKMIGQSTRIGLVPSDLPSPIGLAQFDPDGACTAPADVPADFHHPGVPLCGGGSVMYVDREDGFQ